MLADEPNGQNEAGPRILVVDDNDDNRYTLTLYLDLEGYANVETAADGEKAITRLGQSSFDLLLLDVMMPNVDGYAVLTWLKGQPRLRDLPVIMISALNEVNSVVRCIELGAVDYLTKPFNPVLLKARLGSSLERKRLQDELRFHLGRLEYELEHARQLQLGMVPSVFPPPTPDRPIATFASMVPAHEVGGDLYDFFDLDDGTICFLVGDVSGKGMPAALFMARAKSLIRIVTELIDGTAGPAEIIARVNRDLCQNNSEMMFVTLFFGMLNQRTGSLKFCNAGHNLPYLLIGDTIGPVEDIKGPVLGVRPNAHYQTGHLVMAPATTIYLYTDGVTEAMNEKDELYSEERLESVLRDVRGADCTEVINAVTTSVRTFVGNAQQADDITMLAIRRL
jgi:phosphoserine phosphatase RsbU/P